MQPEQDQPRRSEVFNWVQRIGPARSLFLALFSLSLLLLGCYTLTERRIIGRRPATDEVQPPEVSVDHMVRVRLLGSKPRAAIELEVTGPFEISSEAPQPIQQELPRLPVCTARVAPSGGINLGGAHYPNDDLLISPMRDASIVVEGKTYRGLLRIHSDSGGLFVTNHVDIESYLRGVLRGELPSRFHDEAFKAQCVAARTYVLYQKRNRSADSTFDVYDSERSQMYIGVLGEDERAVGAVAETRGQICVWRDQGEDKLFCTYYSSTCGGRSQHVNHFKPNDPDVPPLRGNVECKDCYLAKFYRWKPVKLSKTEVTRRIVANYPSIARLGTIVGLRPKELTVDGRIVRIHLDGSTGQNETLVGEDFRLSVGGRVLKSTNFVIEAGPDFFLFRDGRGYGHGVGLCQHGMETKARRGMGYKAILARYYPTSRIKTLYN
ncbi:MAG: SpoIID/LytB domain-containing protein [Phycisphaerales bacterium]|nr:SpoIID/LytB domain-containing protein [Phycisphaerales bacterium]